MHRATPYDINFRGYSSGGCRTLIDTVNDKSLMQECTNPTGMKGEGWPSAEAPQNYGFTSVVMPADKGQDGQINGSAEGFMSFIGGNRNFPVCGVMDDRRHRLKGLDNGDVAMFRTKDDSQQFHMSSDGGFWSADSSKTVRMALVSGGSSTPQQQQQQQGSSQGGQGGQQGQKKPTGQQSVKSANQKSTKFVDVTSNRTRVQGSNSLLMLEDGNGYVHASDDKQVWLGMEKGKAKFSKVLTEDGPCDNVWGRLGGGGALAATASGKRGYYATSTEIDRLTHRIAMLEQRLDSVPFLLLTFLEWWRRR
jgi:phage gp45-like